MPKERNLLPRDWGRPRERCDSRHGEPGNQFVDCCRFGQCNPSNIAGWGVLPLPAGSDSLRRSSPRGRLLCLQLLL